MRMKKRRDSLGPRAECWGAVPWQNTGVGGGLDCGRAKVLGRGLVVGEPRFWDVDGTANVQVLSPDQ